MFLKNFSKLIQSWICGGNTDVILLNGNSYSVSEDNMTYSYAFPYYIIGSIGSSYGIILGDGTDEPTINDYNLSGNKYESDKLSFSNAKSKISNDDGSKTVKTIITATNITNNDITISEIGLIVYPKGSPFMIERQLLSSPVTIPANGGVGQIEYSITCTSFI